LKNPIPNTYVNLYSLYQPFNMDYFLYGLILRVSSQNARIFTNSRGYSEGISIRKSMMRFDMGGI